MQLLRERRDSPNGLGDVVGGDRQMWFRYGVLSATVVAPLVSRWRSLRAAERARALWEARQTATRWSRTKRLEMVSAPPPAQRDVRPGLWLAGIGVGLVAAGAVVYILARRNSRVEEEPLDMPLDGGDVGANGSYDESAAHVVTRAMSQTANEVAKGGANRSALGEQTGRNQGADEMTTVGEDLEEPPSPPAPLFVGNARTLIYVPADGEDAPPVDVRVYFATEEQARQAGYQAASGATLGGDTGN